MAERLITTETAKIVLPLKFLTYAFNHRLFCKQLLSKSSTPEPFITRGKLIVAFDLNDTVAASSKSYTEDLAKRKALGLISLPYTDEKIESFPFMDTPYPEVNRDQQKFAADPKNNTHLIVPPENKEALRILKEEVGARNIVVTAAKPHTLESIMEGLYNADVLETLVEPEDVWSRFSTDKTPVYKLQIARLLQPDIFFEDSPKNALVLAEEGICVFLVTHGRSVVEEINNRPNIIPVKDMLEGAKYIKSLHDFLLLKKVTKRQKIRQKRQSGWKRFVSATQETII